MYWDLIEIIAETCHEANRGICKAIGEVCPSWADAPQSMKDSSMRGVIYRMENPHATAEDQHNAWVKDKMANGWVWGLDKNFEKKTHPCIKEYKYLPLEQKIKDHVFATIVNVLKNKSFDIDSEFTEQLQTKIHVLEKMCEKSIQRNEDMRGIIASLSQQASRLGHSHDSES